MTRVPIYLLIVGEAFFIALFFTVLYIIGGISHGIKDIKKKMNEIEKKLETKNKRRLTRRSR